MHRNLICLLVLLVVAIFSVHTTATPIITDENALRILRTYMEQYQPELADLNNYVVVDEMRSNKRGLGPRPLRFGR